MRHGTQGHVVEPREPPRVPVWRGRVAGPHESTRTLGWRLRGKRVFGLESDGATGIVGPGNSIGTVTQMRKGVMLFIPVDLH